METKKTISGEEYKKLQDWIIHSVEVAEIKIENEKLEMEFMDMFGGTATIEFKIN